MNWDYLADLMKTLGHPVRLRLIAHLCEGDDNVGEMARTLGVRPAAVSQQLAILRMRGLVSRTQVGGHAVYTLQEQQLQGLLNCAIRCDRPRTSRSEPVLERREDKAGPSWTDGGRRAVGAGVKS